MEIEYENYISSDDKCVEIDEIGDYLSLKFDEK